MKTGKFRVSQIFIVLALALSLFCCISGCSSDYTDGSLQTLDKMDISANLLSSGDMKVTETWVVNLQNRDKVYRNIYRTFPADSTKIDGITDFSVTDNDQNLQYSYIGDIDPENVSSDRYQNCCYIHQTSDNIELGWFMPSIEQGVRSFTFTYTVKNIVQVYSDTAVLYNFFLPDNFSLPVQSLNGTIHFPQGAQKSSVFAWLHTDIAASSLSIDSANQVSFTAQNIPSNTSVEVRLCTPPELFAASDRRTDTSQLASIQSQEAQWAQAYEEKKAEEARRQYILGLIDVFGGVLLVLTSLLIFFRLKSKNKRVHVTVPEYTREIPGGNSPAGIANLFYYYSGGVTQKVKQNMFSATFLSLAHKGYLRLDVMDQEIQVTLTPERKKMPLTESEQVFFDIIEPAAEVYGSSMSMKQFKTYAESHAKKLDFEISDFIRSSKAEIAGRGYYKLKAAGMAAAAGFGSLLILAALLIMVFGFASGTYMVYLPLGGLIAGTLLISAGARKQPLSEAGETDHAVWHGLKKYMLDFSRMTEYGVPELTLWEEYLVYATMMGISEKVCEQLKLVYPSLSDSNYIDTNFRGSFLYYYFLTNSMGRNIGPAAPFNLGSSIGSAMSGISTAATRLAHPVSTGSAGGGGFGGGGFSGGGGGFGGGGGGGVR